jgi:DNA polymerase alpha subunit A
VHQLLHGRCTELKGELRALMLRHGIKSMRLVPVKRSYAFEDGAIPARSQWVIKVRRPRARHLHRLVQALHGLILAACPSLVSRHTTRHARTTHAVAAAAAAAALVQVRYPNSLPTLPMGLSGATFSAIAATNQSPLEALLLKRRLRGPGWCLLSGAVRKEAGAMVRECGLGAAGRPGSCCVRSWRRQG